MSSEDSKMIKADQDLKNLTRQEIRAAIKELQQADKEYEDNQFPYFQGKVKDFAFELAEELQIDPKAAWTRLTKGTSPKKGTTLAKQYIDPNNPENSWAGRGRKPVWLMEYLNEGRSLEEFKVKK